MPDQTQSSAPLHATHSAWPPFREPLRQTLVRTVTIALVGGVVLSRGWMGMHRWPLATFLVFWFSFGGHWVEVAFLNGLRPHVPSMRAAQFGSRICVWFVGGIVIGLGMTLSVDRLGGWPVGREPAWWVWGPVFIAVELVAHVMLQLLGKPSVYNGRG